MNCTISWIRIVSYLPKLFCTDRWYEIYRSNRGLGIGANKDKDEDGDKDRDEG